MTEKEKYKMAMQLMRRDKESRKKASDIFNDLVETANDRAIKMQSILSLVVLLNQVKNNSRIIEVCEKGIVLGNKLKDYGSVAYLMSVKAKSLELLSSLYNYHRQSLRSPLGWFNYSLESDKKMADVFKRKGESAEDESKKLIENAIKLAEMSNRPDALANILMMSGQIYGGMYLARKIRKMNKPKLFLFLNKFYLDDLYLIFIEGDRETRLCIKKAEELLIRASDIFESLGDRINQAYAFYNLANQLRTARKFRKAKICLAKAKNIAEAENEIPLIESIKILEKAIKEKNKDTPDYLSGKER